MLELTFTLKSIEHLHKITEVLVKYLNKKDKICFSGEMGVGKTTFISSLIHKFDSEIAVTSPTFTLINTYETQKMLIYHLDLYRLNNTKEIALMDLDRYFEDEALILLEWSEKLEGNFEYDFLGIELSYPTEISDELYETREIKFTAKSTYYSALIDKISVYK